MAPCVVTRFIMWSALDRVNGNRTNAIAANASGRIRQAFTISDAYNIDTVARFHWGRTPSGEHRASGGSRATGEGRTGGPHNVIIPLSAARGGPPVPRRTPFMAGRTLLRHAVKQLVCRFVPARRTMNQPVHVKRDTTTPSRGGQHHVGASPQGMRADDCTTAMRAADKNPPLAPAFPATRGMGEGTIESAARPMGRKGLTDK